MVETQENSNDAKARFENHLICAFFAFLLAFFFAANIYKDCKTAEKTIVSQNENRILSTMPTIHSLRRDLPRFATAFEIFYNDHAFGRLKMTQWRSLLLYQIFSASSSPVVAIGKDNWLFWLIEPVVVDDPFTDDQLKLWSQLLQNRSDILAAQNIKFVFFIVPEKSSVYSDYLEPQIKLNPLASRMRQLNEYLNTHTSVEVIDLLPVLQALKHEHKAYLQTDTHWTDYAGMIAAREICTVIQKWLPISSVDLHAIRFAKATVSGDLARLLGLKGLVKESANVLDLDSNFKARTPEGGKAMTAVTTPRSQFITIMADPHLPRAFVMRDSFSIAMLPHLAERFSFVKYFWDQSMPIKMLQEAKPNVVIEEMAERHLYTLGQFDDLAFGSLPYYPNHQIVLPAESSRLATKKNALAVFDQETALMRVSAVAKDQAIQISMTWKALKKYVPNDTITVHLLDANNNTLATIDYPQNQSYLSLEEGDRWEDEIAIKYGGNKKPVKLALTIFKTRQLFSPVVSQNTDWKGYRAIFPITLERSPNQEQSN